MIVTTLTVLSLLAGSKSAGCYDRCAAAMSKCMDQCNGAQKCTDGCNRRAQPCNDSCGAADDKQIEKSKADSQKLPCKYDEVTKKVTPCSDAEQKEMMKSLKEQKGWCKQPGGDYAPCPGEEKKAMEALKKQGIKIDCTDANGMPVECPHKN